MSDTATSGSRQPARVPAWAAFADLLAFALLAIAVAIHLTGGVRTTISHVRLSLTTAWRPAVLALLVVGLRHLACRRPSLPGRILALAARILASASRLWARWRPLGLVPDDCTLLAGDGRHAARMRGRELALITGLMVVLTCLVLHEQLAHMGRVPGFGDPLFSMWRMAWTAHQLPRDPLHLFDGNMFYPEKLTLAYSDAMLLPAFAAAPFVWLGVPVVIVYNVFVLATFVLGGVAMYVLARTLTGRAPAAVVAAVVFAFYPFRFEHYPHFELLWSFWMPLVLLAVHRTLASGRVRDGLAAGAALAAQVFSSIYLGVFLAVFVAPVWAVVAIGWRRIRRGLGPLAAGAALAGVMVAPLAVPYLQARQIVGERPTGETQVYSAVPADYLAPHWSSATYKGLRGESHSERELFPGVVAIVLALIALWPPMSASRLAYGVGLLFAFEVSLGFNGYIFPLLHRFVPVFHGLRVPARMSMLAGFSLAMLAGFGIARVTRSIRLAAAWALAAAAALMVLVESRPSLPYQEVVTKPDAIYAWLSRQPTGIVAELPAGSSTALERECRYLYASTFHWQRLLNGYSGFAPASYWELSEKTSGFPDDRSMALLAARGTDYVVIHQEYYDARYLSVVIRVERRKDLREVARAGPPGFESRLYQIVR